jgi:hypothetical protein
VVQSYGSSQNALSSRRAIQESLFYLLYSECHAVVFLIIILYIKLKLSHFVYSSYKLE